MKKFFTLFLLGLTHLGFSKFVYKYPSNVKLKIDGDILAFCMAKEISSYEKPKINPSTSYKCSKSWAKKIAKSPNDEITFALFDRTLLDNYLRIDPNRACDYETGKENQLRDWVMNQKDNSIDHIKVFKEALKLNQGKVYDAWMTIHQLLRNEARYWSTKYYAYESNQKHEEDFWNKFVDIRGELPERGPNFKADHAGSWYRMWGMMLNRIADTREPISDEMDCGEEVWMIDRGINTLWNDVVAIGAEAIKPVFMTMKGNYKAGGDLFGKTQVNLAGNKTASRLDAYFSGKYFTDKKYQNINCDKSPYLIPSP